MTAADALQRMLDDDNGSDPFLDADERQALRTAIELLAERSAGAPRSAARHVSFFVPGLPRPQGSKTMGVTRTGQAYMREAAPGLTQWRRAVRDAAAANRVTWIKQSPLVVLLKFVMPATQACPVGWAPVKPDIDKLERAVLDGLTQGGVLVDDDQVVMSMKAKVRGSNTGVWVFVRDAGPLHTELAFMDGVFHDQADGPAPRVP